MVEISDMQVIVRLVVSAVLSSMVGFEREIKGRAAGLRTHVLVGLSSCLLMIVSIKTATSFSLMGTADPGRIAAGVVTGVGILCAGTVMRFGASVKGLTTAASMWAVAALGLSVGLGYYTASLSATVLILATLLILSRLERVMTKK